jgi:hypothetical protein
VAPFTRAVVAVLTCIRLLSSVYPQVRRQVALVARAVVAMSTLKGLLSSVQPQVRRQVALVARAVVAVGALKGLLSSVQPQVCRQAALLARVVVAVLADVHHHLRTRECVGGLLGVLQHSVARQHTTELSVVTEAS